MSHPSPRPTGPRANGAFLASTPLRRRAVRGAGTTMLAGMAAMSLLACSCSKDAVTSAPGGSADSTATPTTLAPTTTTPPPTWPLTGVVGDPAAMNIPAIAVKVDNNPDARPHAGINQADMVYELQVEGITRFMEIFHSDTPDRVGPVRSARSSDIDLFGSFHRPILVWSGGNSGVTGEINNAANDGLIVPIVDDGGTKGPRFFRDFDRQRRGILVEHTLFANLQEIRAENTPADAVAPPPIFSFRPSGAALSASASDASGVVVSFHHESSGNTVQAEYAWDAERACWDRFQLDTKHDRADSALVDEGGGAQVCPQNVVVLFLHYSPDPIDSRSPKADSVGTGTGYVFSAGKVTIINWSRPTPQDGWTLTDQAGAPVALTPGKTWVELPKADIDKADVLDPAAAGELLAARK